MSKTLPALLRPVRNVTLANTDKERIIKQLRSIGVNNQWRASHSDRRARFDL
jgi:hypothetical protein